MSNFGVLRLAAALVARGLPRMLKPRYMLPVNEDSQAVGLATLVNG